MSFDPNMFEDNVKKNSNEESSCQVCSNPDDDQMVQCDDCDLWHHYGCVGVSSDIENKKWSCANCLAVESARRTASKLKSVPPGTGDPKKTPSVAKSQSKGSKSNKSESVRSSASATSSLQELQEEFNMMAKLDQEEQAIAEREREKAERDRKTEQAIAERERAIADRETKILENKRARISEFLAKKNQLMKQIREDSSEVEDAEVFDEEELEETKRTIATWVNKTNQNKLNNATESVPVSIQKLPAVPKVGVAQGNEFWGPVTLDQQISRLKFQEEVDQRAMSIPSKGVPFAEPNDYPSAHHHQHLNYLKQGDPGAVGDSNYPTVPQVESTSVKYQQQSYSFDNDGRPSGFVNVAKVLPEVTKQHLVARKAYSTYLPSFSGMPEDWPLFISIFKRSTTACAYSHEDNLLRLQKCLKGDALDAVRSRLMIPSMVPSVIDTLEMMFGRPEIIIHSLTEGIKKLPSPRVDKFNTIVNFSNAVQNLTATMEASGLKAHLCNPTLLAELTERLPEPMKSDWAVYRFRSPELNLITFSSWLAEYTKTRIYVNMPTLYSKQVEPKRDIPQKKDYPPRRDNQQMKEGFLNTHQQSKPTASAGNDKPSAPEDEPKFQYEQKCRVCEGKCPNFSDCDKFMKYNSKERWRAVRTAKRCYNCLRYHPSFRCRKPGACGENGCTMRHHPLLHTEVPSTSEESNSSKTSEKSINMHKVDRQSTIFRVVPIVLYGKDVSFDTYAFLDEGSSITLLEDDLAEELNLGGVFDPLCLKWTGGTKRQEEKSRRVSLRISGRGQGSREFNIQGVRTVQSLNLPIQSLTKGVIANYPHLKKLPIEPYDGAVPRILIGVDNWQLGIPLRSVEGKEGEPFATKTRLGWCVIGSGNNEGGGQSFTHLHACDCRQNDVPLELLVKGYFSLEALGVAAPKEMLISDDAKRAQEILDSTTIRVGNRFETGLLWRYDRFELPNSYPMALRRLECLNRKISKDPDLGRILNEKIEEYVKKGYARKLTVEELSEYQPNVWYLPIFAVTNPNKPGKVRLVWDAAAKVADVCLNTMLLTGPDLLTPLLSVLFQFRERSIGLCADISEMFHQVRIRKADQNSQRFLWYPPGKTEPDVYAMEVMTFGATCSPSSAQFVKNKNAQEFAEQYPRAAESIIRHHYVDDLLDSIDTKEEAIQLAHDVRFVHQQGGFVIRNFISNSPSVAEAMGETGHNDKNLAMGEESGTEKVLGMWWCTERDTFTYRVSKNPKLTSILDENHRPTKREVLRTVMMVFDPLGLIGHFLVYVKALLQEMWRKQMGWDDELEDDLYHKWVTWTRLLPQIERIEVPRCYLANSSFKDHPEVQLHVFVDASEQAYAAAAYLRVGSGDDVQVALVCAKSRVAPLKILTIPRLELEAAVLGTRLANSVSDKHSIKITSRHFWSDSQTVLGWLKSDHRRYRQFVAFRVSEILETTEMMEWRYVPTKENVADDGTKWAKIPTLKSDDRWFKGPPFLYQPQELWPEDKSCTVTTEEELRVNHHHTAPICQLLRLQNFSTWRGVRRGLAGAIRYTRKLLAYIKDEEGMTALTRELYIQAETLIYRQTQEEGFPKEMEVLKANLTAPLNQRRSIDKSSPIYDKYPFLDDKGVIRAWGRIDAVKGVSQDVKHPVLLPRYHHVTKLVILDFHQKYHHLHQQTVINEIKQRYLFPRMRTTIQTTVKTCQACKIRKTEPKPPMMGDLPHARLSAFTRPFTHMGIDYFGPIIVKVGRRQEKRWGVLATCMTTRAIHLEVAHSLSADSCILAIRNITNRRGMPQCIYSDNGTNFRGASSELKMALSRLDGSRLEREFTNEETQWHFIPPASPHMGGSWERLVRSVKVVLTEITPSRHPTDELLRSMLTEVENIINSRPLTYVPLEEDNEAAITPNHFLLGSANGTKCIGDIDDDAVLLRKQWMASQQYANLVWKRWVKEYLPELTRRSKWFEPTKPLAVGDLVLIVDPNNKRNTWPRGKVIKTLPGKDGQIRVAEVQTSKGLYTRPVSKLAVLDVNKGTLVPPNQNTEEENVT